MVTGKDVWVVAEVEEGGDLTEVTLEMMGEGRKLADRLGESLCAVLMGHNVTGLAEILEHHGADKIYLLESPLLAKYTTDAYVTALTDLIREHTPAIVTLGATPNGRDLASRAAARLKIGLAANCIILKINNHQTLEMTRSTHDDKVYTTVVCLTAGPQMATIRPGVIGIEEPKVSHNAEVIPVKVRIDPSAIRTRVIGFIRGDPKTLDIDEAESIVAGGRGVGGAEKWSVIEELADALGGSVGGSRVPMDHGWIPRQRMVGQTGRTVKPKLYVAAGISGAHHHVAGMKDARLIIAINTDHTAPIFKLADLGLVADLHRVLPAITARLRALPTAVTNKEDREQT